MGRWKRMRVIMNPTFSGSKLKEVSTLFAKLCEDHYVSKPFHSHGSLDSKNSDLNR